jgi:hypothetical protein
VTISDLIAIKKSILNIKPIIWIQGNK